VLTTQPPRAWAEATCLEAVCQGANAPLARGGWACAWGARGHPTQQGDLVPCGDLPPRWCIITTAKIRITQGGMGMGAYYLDKLSTIAPNLGPLLALLPNGES